MAKIVRFNHKSASADLTVWGDGTATVSRVYSRIRGEGHGTGLMEVITQYADERQLTLALIAWPFDHSRNGLTARRLVPFYQKFGFNPGTMDVLVGTFMDRQPKSQEIHVP